MNTRNRAAAAATAATATTNTVIPPLPLPPQRSENAFLDASPLVESIAAVAPLPDAGSRRRTRGGAIAIDVGDGDVDDDNNHSHGVVAGAWLSDDGSRGVAWEVEPEVGEASYFDARWERDGAARQKRNERFD